MENMDVLISSRISFIITLNMEEKENSTPRHLQKWKLKESKGKRNRDIWGHLMHVTKLNPSIQVVGWPLHDLWVLLCPSHFSLLPLGQGQIAVLTWHFLTIMHFTSKGKNHNWQFNKGQVKCVRQLRALLSSSSERGPGAAWATGEPPEVFTLHFPVVQESWWFPYIWEPPLRNE